MISIIVPVYNVEQYLAACIRSILKQTYADFELILVDDGSPDRCGEICDAFSLRDSRIRVIHQRNGGASRARNAGMDVACGEWITFIDSDDLVTPRFLASFRVQDNEATDLVVQGWRNLRNGHLGAKYRFDNRRFSSLTEALVPALLIFRGPVCKLFKRSLIVLHDLRFPEGVTYAEDSVFYYEYLNYCNSIQTYDSCRYFYRHDRADSASCLLHDPFTLWSAKEACLSRLNSLFRECQLESPYPKQEDIVELKGMFYNLFHLQFPYSAFVRFMNNVKNSRHFRLTLYRPGNVKDLAFLWIIRFFPVPLAYLLLKQFFS